MYVVSLSEDNRVLDVYDTDVYLDEGVQIFPITPDEQQKIWASGWNGDWKYIDGTIVHDPLPRPENNPDQATT